MSDPENFRRAIQPNTKLLYGETIVNPFGNIFPLEEVAKVAEEFRIPLMIDNTTATPYLCRPFEWGAHIVTHSTSKYIGGHGTSLGGVIVDSGKFKWAGSERHKNFNTPDPSYHEVVYAEDFGPLAFISKARAGILRDLGTSQSPFNSWLFIQGLETLSLRMDRHVQNAQAVAEFLVDQRLGETDITDPVEGIYLHPDFPRQPEVTVLAGGLIYRSHDHGRTWHEHLPSEAGDLPVTAIFAPQGFNQGKPVLLGLAGGKVIRLGLS